MHKESLWLDTTLVLSSFVLAFGVVSKHDPESKVSKSLAALLVITGTCFYTRTTYLLHKLLLSTHSGLKLIRRFDLSLSDCLDISNKWVCIFCVNFSTRHVTNAFFLSELCQRSSLCSPSSLGFWYAIILAGGTFWRRATFFPNLMHGKTSQITYMIRLCNCDTITFRFGSAYFIFDIWRWIVQHFYFYSPVLNVLYFQVCTLFTTRAPWTNSNSRYSTGRSQKAFIQWFRRASQANSTFLLQRPYREVKSWLASGNILKYPSWWFFITCSSAVMAWSWLARGAEDWAIVYFHFFLWWNFPHPSLVSAPF